MQLAMIGLGKMGGNMSARLLRGGHSVVVYDHHPENIAKYEKLGAKPATGLAHLTSQLSAPRIVWIMVPAGKPVDETIASLLPGLEPGDIIIDGGNSNYKETRARAERLATDKILFIDAGTSGGVWGLENGYCLMVGGEPGPVKHCEPIFRALAQQDGYAHVGPAGAGHYVKMVHNGIEYSMMQGYAEGFELMSKSQYSLDLARIADLWMQGSVVRSWLLELTAAALKEDPKLEGLKGYVQDSGEGRWTILEALDKAVPVPTLTAALFTRFRSRQEESFAEKMLAAMRKAFGGHAVKKRE
jgi:6-phosphogluconate dehydrogenase